MGDSSQIILSQFYTKVIKAVEKLKECGNQYYQDIQIDRNFMARKNQPEEENEVNLEEMEEESDEEVENSNDPVKKFQSKQNCETCLTPSFLESQVVTNNGTDQIIKSREQGLDSVTIASGENKIPTTRLRENDSDAKAFPKHFPSGLYGLNHPRKYKVTEQMVINQRLLNEDERFSKDNFFLFMASGYIEQQSLEKQIDISGTKGTFKTNANGARTMHLSNLFDVFKKVKGTPRYWQAARTDLVAKVKQLGPFHLFYTFSCGEMR